MTWAAAIFLTFALGTVVGLIANIIRSVNS